MFTDKAPKSEKSSAAVATAKKQQPKKDSKKIQEPVIEPAAVAVAAVAAVEKKKRAPRKKAAAKDSDMEDLIADLDATKITDTKKRSGTPVLKEKFDLKFPGREYNIIIKFLRELDESGEVEGIDEHIAAMQSGMALAAKAEHAGNNGNIEKAREIFGEAYLEYFWDAFDAITSAGIIPYDLEADWEKMKEEIEEIYK